MRGTDVWYLRCATQFMDEIIEALYDGGAWVRTAGLEALGEDPSDLIDALSDRLVSERWHVEQVLPTGAGCSATNRVRFNVNQDETELLVRVAGRA
ncbi:hypothetical protein MASR1M32_32310 [Rhodobacter sp.]